MKRSFTILAEGNQFEEVKLLKDGITKALLEKYTPSKRLKKIENSITKNNNLRVAQRNMNNKQNSRNAFIHLYNPRKEGIGSYDVHYINAYKKKHRLKSNQKGNNTQRYVA